MSVIQRYDSPVGWMDRFGDGEYVTFADHEADCEKRIAEAERATREEGDGRYRCGAQYRIPGADCGTCPAPDSATGIPGHRDPEAKCPAYAPPRKPGVVGGDCRGDGHYLCKECANFAGDEGVKPCTGY